MNLYNRVEKEGGQMVDGPSGVNTEVVQSPNNIEGEIDQSHYLEIRRGITAFIEQLAGMTSFFKPGEFLTNSMGGGEKKVIHVDGYESKDRLTWDELAPYLEQDRIELEQIAKTLSERGFGDFDEDKVRSLIVERMTEILTESVIAIEKYQEVSMQFKSIEGEKPAKEAIFEELLKALVLEEGRYTLDMMRVNASIMKRGDIDMLLVFPDGSKERINIYSVGLVAGGVFQKGKGDHDQHYADSPIRFFNSHLGFNYGGEISGADS